MRVRNTVNLIPGLKRFIKTVYFFVQGTPQVSYTEITKESISQCVGKDAPTILEVGANDGEHTLRFLEAFENPRIYAFEPDPRAAARFRKKVGARPNVHLFEMALSDRNGEVAFHQSGGQRAGDRPEVRPEGWDLSGSIRKPKGHLLMLPSVTFDRTITVSTSTLDAWCDEHHIDIIDFLWMDVQGAERDVLTGAERALRRTRFIFTECGDRERVRSRFVRILVDKRFELL